MIFFEQICFFIDFLFNFIFSLTFCLFFFFFIILEHFILFYIRDRNYIKPIKAVKRKQISLDDLKKKPLVNIIIPAWKENENFRKILFAIRDLKYPNIKVIINAGGNKETINIANSFKIYENFKILCQKKGEGKNKAINSCINHVSEGLIYLIDADIFLTDDIFFYMIFHLINEDYDIVLSPLFPHHTIINKDIVKYLFINRNREFRQKYTPFVISGVLGVNLCFTYKIIKSIGKLPEGKLSDDNAANAIIFKAKGFKYYYLYDKRVESFTFPNTIRDSIQQNIRWIENSLLNLFRTRNLGFLKFFLLLMISIYLFISPILIFVNLYLFLIGILFFFSLYLSRIRKCIFYHLTVNEEYHVNLSLIFFIKLIFYTYMDALIRIIAFFEVLFFKKKYKKRKNLI